MKGFVLILFLQLCVVQFQAERDFRFTNCISSYDRRYIGSILCRIRLVQKGITALALRVNITRPLDTVLVHFSVFKKANNGYRPTFMDITMNLCDVFSGKNLNPLSNYLKVSVFEKTLNRTSCPISGVIGAEDFTVNLTSFPFDFPLGEYFTKFASYEKVPTRPVCTLTVYIQVKEKFIKQ